MFPRFSLNISSKFCSFILPAKIDDPNKVCEKKNIMPYNNWLSLYLPKKLDEVFI